MKKIPNLRYKLTVVGLVAVIAFLLTCNRRRDAVQPPKVTPVSELKKTVAKDETELNRVRDSASRIIKKLDQDLAVSDKKLVDFIFQYGTKEFEIDAELAREVPDTCRELQIRLTDKFNKLKTISAGKDREFNNKISTLERIRRTQERQLTADSVFQAKQRAVLDTCFKNQTALQAYADKVKPRRSIYVGITGIGSAVKIYGGGGVNLGLENRRGTKFEIGVLKLNGIKDLQYTVGYKKTLFKF